MSFAHHLTISGNHVSLDAIYNQFDRGNHSRLERDAMPRELSPEDMQRMLSGMKMVFQGTDHLNLYTNLKPKDVEQFILAKFPDVNVKLIEHTQKMAPFKQFKITAEIETLQAICKEFGSAGFFQIEKMMDANGKLSHLVVHHQIHPVRIQMPIQQKFPNVKFSE